MKFFVDTADTADIAALAELGLVDGVTTNPSLVAQAVGEAGPDVKDVIMGICAAVKGPVSAEVTATRADLMVREGHALARLAPNVVVKLPITLDGLSACATLSREGVATNLTLCFNAVQGLMAAKAGATFVSPFIGRLDDIGADGMELIADLRRIFDTYGFKTEILAASIRSPAHVRDCALAGADAATVPPKVLRGLVAHPLTDRGLDSFLKDWASTGQSIIPDRAPA